MAGKLPWFPFYYRDFFDDEKVQLMSNAQVGMYLRLLAHQWQEGSLPNDPTALSRLALAGPGEEEGMLALVRVCFAKNGRVKRLLNLRLEQVKKEQEEKDQVNQARARKGGLARSMLQAQYKHSLSSAQASYSESESESESESDLKTSSSVSQKKPSSGVPDPVTILSQAEEVLTFMNTKTGKHFRVKHPNGTETENVKLLRVLFGKGYTVTNIIQVIANRRQKWDGDPKMQEFLRPSTLFRASNFTNYFGELGKGLPT